MGRRRREQPSTGGRAARPPGRAAPTLPVESTPPAQPTGADRAPPDRSRRITAPVVGLILAGIGVLVLVSALLLWPKRHFDMVETLASIAAKEGAWDNPWDLQP